MRGRGKGEGAICYIALGSNQGERIKLCDAAVEQLASLPQSQLRRRSAWYETEPVVDGPTPPGDESPGWFINGVVELETTLSPAALFDHCLAIEARLGRQRIHSHRTLAHSGGDAPLPPPPPSPYGVIQPFSRPIDLDLLLFDALVLQTDRLVIPHPRFHLRRFVLQPLVELAPSVVHPVIGLTAAALLDRLTDPYCVRRASPAPHLP